MLNCLLCITLVAICQQNSQNVYISLENFCSYNVTKREYSFGDDLQLYATKSFEPVFLFDAEVLVLPEDSTAKIKSSNTEVKPLLLDSETFSGVKSTVSFLLAEEMEIQSENQPEISINQEEHNELEQQKQSDGEKEEAQPQNSKAGNIYLALSPISWHLDDIKSDVNDFPYGVGLSFDLKTLGTPGGSKFFDDVIMAIEFSIFKDSDFGYPATFVTTNFRKNIFDALQLGLGAGLIYTTQLKEISGSPILPILLPFVQTDFDFPVNLRIIYIPTISDWKSQQIFITTFIKIN